MRVRPAVHLEPLPLGKSVVEASRLELPEAATRTIGNYLESARLLGKRTAELHGALASDPSDPAFAPERISQQDQRSIYQSISGLSIRAVDLLRSQLGRVPADARDDARQRLGKDRGR